MWVGQLWSSTVTIPPLPVYLDSDGKYWTQITDFPKIYINFSENVVNIGNLKFEITLFNKH